MIKGTVARIEDRYVSVVVLKSNSYGDGRTLLLKRHWKMRLTLNLSMMLIILLRPLLRPRDLLTIWLKFRLQILMTKMIMRK